MEKTPENKNGNSRPEETGLGKLLRNAREERNLDLEEAVRVTKIRRYNLEALENEDWEKLPNQIFVKGFLRSYTRFLGLDEKMVVDRYSKTQALSQKEHEKILKEMKPRPKRWRPVLIALVLALILVLALYYLKKGNVSVVKKIFNYAETPSHLEEMEGKDIEVQPGEPEPGDETSEDIASGPGNAIEEQEQEISKIPTQMPELQVQASPEEEAPEDMAGSGGQVFPAEEQAPETASADSERETPSSAQYSLSATVKSRTWLSISIDGRKAREYLFQAGENITWKAEKGFALLVGNAGGLELAFNGEALDPLGPEGKVVRLRLPEEYNPEAPLFIPENRQ